MTIPWKMSTCRTIPGREQYDNVQDFDEFGIADDNVGLHPLLTM